jgi:hypothetical protein
MCEPICLDFSFYRVKARCGRGIASVELGNRPEHSADPRKEPRLRRNRGRSDTRLMLEGGGRIVVCGNGVEIGNSSWHRNSKKGRCSKKRIPRSLLGIAIVAIMAMARVSPRRDKIGQASNKGCNASTKSKDVENHDRI